MVQKKRQTHIAALLSLLISSVALLLCVWRTTGTNAVAARAESSVISPLACYPDDLTDDERAEIIRVFGARPPAMNRLAGERFFTDVVVWTGDGVQGPSRQAAPAKLTYSFPTDGIVWGLEEVAPINLNRLNEKLYGLFGVFNLDRGREYIRQGLASWRRVSALTYQEVQDNNSPMDEELPRLPTRGDIRIGGIQAGIPNFIAYNAFPSSSFVGVQGADMCINTSYFNATTLSDPATDYRKLRNVIAHEHGHGLGFIHTVPCNSTKLMEPFLTALLDMVQLDEMRGVQRNYGDRYAGNHSPAAAHDFGDLTEPVKRSVVERFLSVNGADGVNNTNEDWFRFHLSSYDVLTLQIIVTPRGGSALQGQQETACVGSGTTVDANRAGDLAVELRNGDGSQIIRTASSSPPGLSELISVSGLVPGTFMVRVYDGGPNPELNQILQLYDLTIRLDSAKAPPKAIAGIDKTIAAFSDCFFMGHLNSYATEPGVSIVRYDWDLNGDGANEQLDNPTPQQFFFSNGVHEVTLRVTDSNGLTATDTIRVTVFASVTTISSVTPVRAYRGQTVPVEITGTNFKHVTAAHVSVSGVGVNVVGEAVSDGLGTELTGLSFVVAPNAPVGARNVSVANQDGSATRLGAFTVDQRPRPIPDGTAFGASAFD
ncbi:MAG: PKD domain-containing protein [Planctomycetota bacterium]